MSTPPKFHWHSRVKTGGPENINGDVETIPSHVNDENAHPSYLKKGQAVPSGQALYVMEQHRASTLSHVKNLVRRDELLGSNGAGDAAVRDYYNDNNNVDYTKNESNYSASSPVKHVITAYALRCILADYATRQDLNAGDGTNLILLQDGKASESHANIGTETRPVRLADGHVVPLPSDSVMTGDVNQDVSGRKTFTKYVPRVSDAEHITPYEDVDFVTVAYLKRKIRELDAGDGTNLIYLDHGVARESTENIGSDKRPVYLLNGTVTELPSDSVMTGNIDQNVDGRKTFTRYVPRVSNATTIVPSADADFVTVAYLKKARQLPVGFCVLTTPTVLNADGTDTGEEYTASKVNAKLEYGTWQKVAEIGNFAYLWLRIG